MKDEPVALDAGEGHEEAIDHIERVVQPGPERAECVAFEVNVGQVHVGLGDRQGNGNEEKRADEEEEDDMVVLEFT